MCIRDRSNIDTTVHSDSIITGNVPRAYLMMKVEKNAVEPLGTGATNRVQGHAVPYCTAHCGAFL